MTRPAPRTALAASFFLALALGSAAAPTFAGGPGFYLPDLTFPTDQVVTGSTKGCTPDAAPKGKAPATCQN
jgi:hypothetical protein